MSNQNEPKRKVGRPSTYDVEMKKWTMYTYSELHQAMKTLITLYPDKYHLNSISNRLFIEFLNNLPSEEKEKIEFLYPKFFGDDIDKIEKSLTSKD